MRYLGIDFGEKRIGLSVGDELGVATPLPALTHVLPPARLEQLGAVIRAQRAAELVLGHPLNMDGTAGVKAREVEAFAAKLQAAFGLPVHLIDERLTTYEAEASIPRRHRRAVRASGLVDSRAACLILQDFLEQRYPSAHADSP